MQKRPSRVFFALGQKGDQGLLQTMVLNLGHLNLETVGLQENVPAVLGDRAVQTKDIAAKGVILLQGQVYPQGSGHIVQGGRALNPPGALFQGLDFGQFPLLLNLSVPTGLGW